MFYGHFVISNNYEVFEDNVKLYFIIKTPKAIKNIYHSTK